jgi:hypothetical protein
VRALNANGAGAESTATATPDAIDLSQFTPVDVPKWDIVQDWMVPDFGVITKASETLKDFMYTLTVCGVTKADVESYRKVLVNNGMTKTSDYSYVKDKVQVSLGTAGVETTKDSPLYVTIEKK